MARQNFYETLGLQRGANPKEIKSAYYEVPILNRTLVIVTAIILPGAEWVISF